MECLKPKITQEEIESIYSKVASKLRLPQAFVGEILKAVPSEEVTVNNYSRIAVNFNVEEREKRPLGTRRDYSPKGKKPVNKVFKKKTNPKRVFTGTKAWYELRTKIIQSASGKCVCGKDGVHVHHIKPVSKYPDLALNEENLVLLCKACHREQHRELPDVLFQ